MKIKKLERLLVIEDNSSHLTDARRFFSRVRGLKTVFATSWTEAEKKIRENAKFVENPKYEKLVEREIRKRGYVNPRDFWVGKHKASEEQKAALLKAIKKTLQWIEVKAAKILVDGVITDLFFPIKDEIKREINVGPNGLVVAARLQKWGIPYVICTSGYHHGSKYEWANYMHRAMDGPEMIDCNVGEGESSHKDWKKAYETLKEIVEEGK